MKHWIINHDDKPLFIWGYVLAAVILSTFVSLFWLLVVVGIHLLFECIKQYSRDVGHAQAWQTIFWELKLDIALIFFAFVIDLYLGFVLGIAGLGGVARAGAAVSRAAASGSAATRSAGAVARAGGAASRASAVASRSTSAISKTAQAGSRSTRGTASIAAIQRTFRAGLMMLDEVVLAIRGLFMGKKEPATDLETGDTYQQAPASKKKLNLGDAFTLVFGAVCIGLIITAPYLTEHSSYTAIFSLMLEELQPFP